MGVVTPAAHQLMRDTEYIYPPLEGIRGERPEQERRRNVGTSGEEPQHTGGNWTLSPLSSAHTGDQNSLTPGVRPKTPTGKNPLLPIYAHTPLFLYVLLKDTLFCSGSTDFIQNLTSKSPGLPQCI